jgi:Peptidase_C39 like family
VTEVVTRRPLAPSLLTVHLRPLPALLATALLAPPVTLLPATAADAATPRRFIAYEQWGSSRAFREGRLEGVAARGGRLELSHPRTVGRWATGTWTSPWVRPGFGVTEVIPSWSATTPGNSAVRVELRTRTGRTKGSWDTLATWALDDAQLHRTSHDSQSDDLGRTAYDTWLAASGTGVSGWRLRVTLLRRTGRPGAPTLDTVGAVASRLPAVSSVRTSRPGAAPNPALGKVLRVPRYSQMIHQGEYPQYDGGGEAWCSPTSTAMVLGYYGALPPPRDYRWVNDAYADPVVDHLARMTYDRHLGGTGNWSFNAAYAASRTGRATVTRLRDLREAERFIAAGIPLVASVTFGAGELDGAPISSTNGHLLVIVGFRANGDVVVNDPAAWDRRRVRRTYDRGQFEDAWLKRYPSGGSMRGSGGLVYVIRDAAHPLPDRGRNRNW